MAEIVKVRGTNGYRVVSTFSGCGGSCLGFEMDGYQILRAHEFVQAAIDCYVLNHPGVPVDGRDIRNVTADEILAATGISKGELDVFEGSPPCKSFSTMGNGPKDWGKVRPYSDVHQRSDDLFFEFARIIEGLQPKVFIGENVSGLVKGSAKGYFLEILRSLKATGYRVEARVLDASWLGVPQSRLRVIFVGVREDLLDLAGEPLQPAFPSPLPYRYTIRDACPWISTNPADAVHAPMVEPGTALCPSYQREWNRLAVGQQSKKYMTLNRCNPEAPCPTITAAGAGHPYERRRMSIAELKRLSSFPDDFIFTGSFAKSVERMGNCVPPLMMRAVASTVRTEILDRCVTGVGT